MWIAKNSITGKTYGKKYDSIYDCQLFIDKELYYLELEMRRCFALEESLILKLADCVDGVSVLESIFNSLSEGMKSLEKGINPYFKVAGKAIVDGDYEKAFRDMNNIYLSRWHKNNIIRCWNVGQKRFADGFDF